MTFLGTPSWHYRGFDSLLPRYCDFWNDVLLYHPNRGLQGVQAPGQLWGSIVNRLAGSSVPLIVMVVTGIVLVLFQGARDVLGYGRGSATHADWVFPAFVVLLYATIPNLTNGVETQRIRYSIEPILYIALIGGGLALARRFAPSNGRSSWPRRPR
jgi:hypothetical protein